VQRQFTRYLIAGVVNTAITYGLLVAALRWLPYAAAYTVAYVSGVAIGYLLQSRFVFRVPLGIRRALRFPLVYVAQYVVGIALLWLLVDRLGTEATWAALVVVVANVPLGFMLSRLLLVGQSTPP
jgi:putative flippase GtrA